MHQTKETELGSAIFLKEKLKESLVRLTATGPCDYANCNRNSSNLIQINSLWKIRRVQWTRNQRQKKFIMERKCESTILEVMTTCDPNSNTTLGASANGSCIIYVG